MCEIGSQPDFNYASVCISSVIFTLRHSVGSDNEKKRKKKAKKLEKKRRKREKRKEKKRKKKEKKRKKEAANMTVGPQIPVKEEKPGRDVIDVCITAFVQSRNFVSLLDSWIIIILTMCVSRKN